MKLGFQILTYHAPASWAVLPPPYPPMGKKIDAVNVTVSGFDFLGADHRSRVRPDDYLPNNPPHRVRRGLLPPVYRSLLHLKSTGTLLALPCSLQPVKNVLAILLRGPHRVRRRYCCITRLLASKRISEPPPNNPSTVPPPSATRLSPTSTANTIEASRPNTERKVAFWSAARDPARDESSLSARLSALSDSRSGFDPDQRRDFFASCVALVSGTARTHGNTTSGKFCHIPYIFSLQRASYAREKNSCGTVGASSTICGKLRQQLTGLKVYDT